MAKAVASAVETSPSDPAAPVAPVAPAGMPNAKASAPVEAVKVTLTVGLAPVLNPLAVALVLTTLPSVFSSASASEFQAKILDERQGKIFEGQLLLTLKLLSAFLPG